MACDNYLLALGHTIKKFGQVGLCFVLFWVSYTQIQLSFGKPGRT